MRATFRLTGYEGSTKYNGQSTNQERFFGYGRFVFLCFGWCSSGGCLPWGVCGGGELAAAAVFAAAAQVPKVRALPCAWEFPCGVQRVPWVQQVEGGGAVNANKGNNEERNIAGVIISMAVVCCIGNAYTAVLFCTAAICLVIADMVFNNKGGKR